MINEVKVSKTAVCKFEDSVTKMYECADKINSAILCIEELIRLIAALIKRLMAVLHKENQTNEKLEVKIKEFEGKLDSLKSILAELESELAVLEFELACTPEFFTVLNSDGDVERIPNPAYDSLCQKISVVEEKKETVEKEIDIYQHKLDQAYNVNHRIDSHIEMINGVISSLEEKSDSCSLMVKELSDIKTSVSTKSLNASSTLKQIMRLIDSYLKLKMKYEQISFINPSENARDNYSNANTNMEHKDDNDKIYRVGDDLKPNNTYEINGYNYRTDEKGRIISAEGKLQFKNHNGRSKMDSRDKVDKGDMKPTDDRGHLIADMFNGSGGIENVVPMDAKLNQGDYKALECTLADAVKDGAKVEFNVEPVYKGNSTRPSEFKVTYSIDGDKTTRVFKNGE